MRARAWIAPAIALSHLACAHPAPVSMAQGERHYAPGDYDHVLHTWTRGTDLFTLNGLYDRLRVDATYLSWDYRWAYVSKYAADASLSEPDRQQLLSGSLDRAQQEHEFYVALETQEYRWGELNRSFTAWRVRLLDDQHREVAPIRIEPIRHFGAADQQYFPFTSPWRQAFRIHFPRRATVNGTEYEVLGPGTRYFILRLSGPLGTADLRWDVSGRG